MDEDQIASLASLLRGRRVALLTGAGCSTESGIPDYRGPSSRGRPRTPIQHRDFLSSTRTRARYWARSTVGWPRFRAASPNPAHRAIAALQRQGVCAPPITQNVDRLHQRAGSQEVIELHGALEEVRCLACSGLEPREDLQDRLLALNPAFRTLTVESAPDGDAELPLELVEGFSVPECLFCEGTLKPDVVFFGDSVPRTRVEAAFARVDTSDALLVVGSSLEVFSGYRFVLRATERGLPVALINLGPSRGDAHAALRVEGHAGEVLPRLVEALTLAA